MELDPREAPAWPELWRSRLGGPDELDRSGVWRFREMLPFLGLEVPVVSLGEGQTPLLEAPEAAAWARLGRLQVKQQGSNPTGSFKDLGMTVCVTVALARGARAVACASTGNTAASMAAYAARAGLQAVLFVARGSVSGAKLAQALDHGALVVECGANFDGALALLRRLAPELGLYLVNSINPFRLEGQKTVVIELLEQRGWRVPDWIAVPGGNLGNVSALAKGLRELLDVGLIRSVPRLAVIQAQGAAPLVTLLERGAAQLVPLETPRTRASAIRIGNPANWTKALRALRWSEGAAVAVSDQEIALAKRALARDGVGCEPASAAALGGVRRLVRSGTIGPDDDVVAILTGHQLKDVEYIEETGVGEGRTLQLDAGAEGAFETVRNWLRGFA